MFEVHYRINHQYLNKHEGMLFSSNSLGKAKKFKETYEKLNRGILVELWILEKE